MRVKMRSQKFAKSPASKALMAALFVGLFCPAIAAADEPPKDQFRERIPVQQSEAQRRRDITRAVDETEPEWIFELMPVLTMMFFDEDRDRPMPGGYFHARRSDIPLNFRIGIEGTSFNSKQRALEWIQIEENNNDDITFFRIPIALEYWHNVNENFDLFAGPALNIIHMDNLADDTGTGLSLSGRAAYKFTEAIGLSLEGGYLFAEKLDTNKTGTVDFSGPFVSTGVFYQF